MPIWLIKTKRNNASKRYCSVLILLMKNNWGFSHVDPIHITSNQDFWKQNITILTDSEGKFNIQFKKMKSGYLHLFSIYQNCSVLAMILTAF